MASCEPHSKAEHMAAPTNAELVKKVLANSVARPLHVRFRGDADIVMVGKPAQ